MGDDLVAGVTVKAEPALFLRVQLQRCGRSVAGCRSARHPRATADHGRPLLMSPGRSAAAAVGVSSCSAAPLLGLPAVARRAEPSHAASVRLAFHCDTLSAMPVLPQPPGFVHRPPALSMWMTPCFMAGVWEPASLRLMLQVQPTQLYARG